MDIESILLQFGMLPLVSAKAFAGGGSPSIWMGLRPIASPGFTVAPSRISPCGNPAGRRLPLDVGLITISALPGSGIRETPPSASIAQSISHEAYYFFLAAPIKHM